MPATQPPNRTTVFARLYNPLDMDALIADIDPLHRQVVNDFYNNQTPMVSAFEKDLQQVVSSDINQLFVTSKVDGSNHLYYPIFTIVRQDNGVETILAVALLTPATNAVPINLCRNYGFSITQTRQGVDLYNSKLPLANEYLKAIKSLMTEIQQVLPEHSVCTTLVHEKTLPFVKSVLSMFSPHSNSHISECKERKLGSPYYWVYFDTSLIDHEDEHSVAAEPPSPELEEIPFDISDVEDEVNLNALVKIHVDGEYLGQWPLSELELKQIDDKFYFKIVRCHAENWNQSSGTSTLLLSRTQSEEIWLFQSSLIGKAKNDTTIYEWYGSSNDMLCDGEIYDSLVRELDKIDLDNYTID